MISTEDLHFFITLTSAVSLADAARKLDVTPPAVTQRLRLLENRLGMRLIDRSGRRMVLTDEGELLAVHARRICDDIGNLSDTLASRRGTVAGHLRVIAPLGFGCYAEAETFRALLVDGRPGAWGRAVAVRDVILSPLPATSSIRKHVLRRKGRWAKKR